MRYAEAVRTVSQWLMLGAYVAASSCIAQAPLPPELLAARQALAARHFLQARSMFAAFASAHPADARAPLGMGDAELALHRYEAAELDYRRAVSLEPRLWAAHKDLVLVEARLQRWDEFDRERALLRAARQRGEPGITPQESDLIDSFVVNGREWLVREYIVPVGRSQARYNFEHFTPAGRVEEYISLEPAAAAQTALQRNDTVAIGKDAAAATPGELALNWYTGHGHGTIRRYATEPSYETLRRDVQHWLRSH